MSERLDRIENILEGLISLSSNTQQQIELTQQQIVVLTEQQITTQQVVQSLAKSIQAHCDDPNRHN
jgi:hypothetical protein